MLRIKLQLFPVKVLQAQTLVVGPLVVVFAALVAILTAKELVRVTVQTHVAEVALVHVITLVVVHALVLALARVVELAQVAVLVVALGVMVTVTVVKAAVALAPVSAGKVIAPVRALSIATMKLLAVMTVITSVATLNGKDWRLAHGRTNHSSNG